MIVAPVPGVEAEAFTFTASPMSGPLGDTVKLADGASELMLTVPVVESLFPRLSVIVNEIVIKPLTEPA